MYDVIIIGGGVTGFAAALYSGRFKLKTLVLTGELKGGLITWAKDVQNYPGFENVSGIELAKKIEDHARRYDVDVKLEIVQELNKQGSIFTVKTAEGVYESKTVIFATGTKVRTLKAPGEDKLKNKGVHYCALCDAFAYNGKTVAVIGGSDSAVIESLILKDVAKKVYIIYRKDKLRAEPINVEKVNKLDNVEVITNTNVLEFIGEEKLEKVKLDNPYKGDEFLKLDGVFVAIGHEPQSELVKPLGVKLDEKGYVEVDKDSKTNVEGLFAAGDVTNRKFKQAITGVAEGVTAAYWAFNYIQK
ncbi:thioredoxin-disulfide reductase [Candidatus Woesearchaeota archaeon]|nr:MAG: thioredoxin-disulfide reductase [Candidatus Woesearchaeota archaeon]